MENQENKVEEVKEVTETVESEEIVFHDETPQQVVEQVKGGKNKFAIISFVLAIVSIVILFIPSNAMWLGWLYYVAAIAGFALSIVGLVQIKKKNETGKAFAILGLVGVILSFVLVIVIGVIQIANMPEEEMNDLILCPYATECKDNGDGTSTCLYVDDTEVKCTTELLKKDQFE